MGMPVSENQSKINYGFRLKGVLREKNAAEKSDCGTKAGERSPTSRNLTDGREAGGLSRC